MSGVKHTVIAPDREPRYASGWTRRNVRSIALTIILAVALGLLSLVSLSEALAFSDYVLDSYALPLLGLCSVVSIILLLLSWSRSIRRRVAATSNYIIVAGALLAAMMAQPIALIGGLATNIYSKNIYEADLSPERISVDHIAYPATKPSVTVVRIYTPVGFGVIRVDSEVRVLREGVPRVAREGHLLRISLPHLHSTSRRVDCAIVDINTLTIMVVDSPDNDRQPR